MHIYLASHILTETNRETDCHIKDRRKDNNRFCLHPSRNSKKKYGNFLLRWLPLLALVERESWSTSILKSVLAPIFCPSQRLKENPPSRQPDHTKGLMSRFVDAEQECFWWSDLYSFLRPYVCVWSSLSVRLSNITVSSSLKITYKTKYNYASTFWELAGLNFRITLTN